MLTRSRLVAILTLLFAAIWPAVLHANETRPDSSSFLLIASNQMADPRFQKAVVLVTRHGNSGPIGVIVNRPAVITLDKLLPDNPAASKSTLFYGGPVYPNQISYLVHGGEAVTGALTISKDIYLAYDLPVLDELLAGKRRYKDLRAMHGLTSWAPGQLEIEVSQGSWYVMPFDKSVIFDRPPAEMWQEMVNRASGTTI